MRTSGWDVARSFAAACALWMVAMLVGSGVASAADTITLAQLDRNEGGHPNQESIPGYTDLAREIPRDFPVPTYAHDLAASNFMPVARLQGVTAAQAAAFYPPVLERQGWTIRRQTVQPGFFGLVACPKTGRCVNLTAASPNGPVKPIGLKLVFFTRSALP
ncbi:hypothetical protein [Salinisphaera hydrothermalis]|uniref:hypothetical protein n=1 Tax=Salinisphaera hydrothermalis TaxID=563188 RepID=UPI0033408E81